MKPQRTIFRIKHGSWMYGTSTPTSDVDYKEVHLPSGEDILMLKVRDAFSSGPEKERGAKNQAGDIDVQSFALHKLFSMLKEGDIIGCEMIFAPESCVELITPEYQYILDNKHRFLSKRVDGYVGYCQRQAAKYGIRGSRVAAVRAICNLLHPHMINFPHMKLGEILGELEIFVQTHEFSAIVPILNKGTGRDILHLEVCDRKVPYTVSIKEAYAIYKRVFDEYGKRSLAAESNEGIDWKAMSHAVRVGRQAIELLQTGNMAFPRPDADYLLKIKRGEIDYKTIGRELEDLLERVEAESKISNLPEQPDHEWIKHAQIALYGGQVSSYIF